MINYKLSSDTWNAAEHHALDRVIRSGRFTMGEEVKKFEQQFAEMHNVRNAIMTNSGSSANLIMMAALKYHPKFKHPLATKPEIIVPTVSWSTTYFPVNQNDFVLRFVDVDPDTFNIDVDAVIDAININTVGVLAVNLLGNPADLVRLQDVCIREDIVLLEDNCESFGAKVDGKFAGTWGEMGTFSFFFSHHLQTMEGGMVVTNDDSVAEYLRSLRAHGWVRDLPDVNTLHNKKGNAFDDSYTFVLPGYCVRPLEMSGATGQCQLLKWDDMWEKRRANAEIAKEHLNGDNFQLQVEDGESSWFGFGITLKGNLTGRRAEVIALLEQNGVEVRPIVAGNFLRNPVIKHLDYIADANNPVADNIHDNGFFIGNDAIDLEEKIIAVGQLLNSFE